MSNTAPSIDPARYQEVVIGSVWRFASPYEHFTQAYMEISGWNPPDQGLSFRVFPKRGDGAEADEELVHKFHQMTVEEFLQLKDDGYLVRFDRHKDA
jgi:hypothetical protein